MKKIFFILFLFLLILICFVSVSPAQEQKKPVPRNNFKNLPRTEIQAKIRTMFMLRLVEYLNLNEDQSTKLLAIIRGSDENRNKLTKERGDLIRKIRNDVDNESVSIKDLSKLVNELENINDKISDEHKEYLGKVEKILEERQYIKFLMFEDRLKEDLFERFRSREPK